MYTLKPHLLMIYAAQLLCCCNSQFLSNWKSMDRVFPHFLFCQDYLTIRDQRGEMKDREQLERIYNSPYVNTVREIWNNTYNCKTSKN